MESKFSPLKKDLKRKLDEILENADESQKEEGFLFVRELLNVELNLKNNIFDIMNSNFRNILIQKNENAEINVKFKVFKDSFCKQKLFKDKIVSNIIKEMNSSIETSNSSLGILEKSIENKVILFLKNDFFLYLDYQITRVLYERK